MYVCSGGVLTYMRAHLPFFFFPRIHFVPTPLFNSGSVLGPRYLKLIHTLLSNLPRLCLWIARVRHDKIPDVLSTETLTTPLRSAPVVLREVKPGVERHNVHNYSDGPGLPSPSDGPRVMRLLHGGAEHSGTWPHQCRRCGRDVARVLRQLNVGAEGQ